MNIKLVRRILISISIFILSFAVLKESGAFSNLFSDFSSLCSASFLLPEDQRYTISRMFDNLGTQDCIEAGKHFETAESLDFSGKSLCEGMGCPPVPIYSLYPLRTVKRLVYLRLPLTTDDLKPLEDLTELKKLEIVFYKGFDFTNITLNNRQPELQNPNLPVKGYTKLEPLTKLKKLEFLSIVKAANGYPLDLNSAISNLPNIRLLNVIDLDFMDVASISNIQNLQSIILTINPNADLKPLLNLKRLERLSIAYTKGAKCPNFTKATICAVRE